MVVLAASSLLQTGCAEDPRDALARLGIEPSPDALVARAEQGHLQAVELLLDVGIPVDVRDEDERTPLLLAAENGRSDVAILLLDRGADPSARDAFGRTPLLGAAESGSLAIARELIARGAPADLPEANGMRPLMHAAASGSPELVAALLEARADPNARGERGNTPLMHAAQAGDARAVEILLAAGARPDAVTLPGGSSAIGLAAAGGHVLVVRRLAASGAAVEHREGTAGMTPLAVAALRGRDGAVAALLEAGADPEARSAQGETPLMIAAVKGHGAVTRRLLAAGADPEATTSAGVTALLIAAAQGHGEVVRELLAGGANPFAENPGGLDAARKARDGGHAELAALLEESKRSRAAAPSDRWHRLAAVAGQALVPAGWSVADPFTDATPYWPGATALSGGSARLVGLERALVRSPAERRSQVFLLRAPIASLDAWLRSGVSDLEDGTASIRERKRITAADGTPFEYVVARMPPGLLAGEDLTYVVAYAAAPPDLVVVDAGGPTGSFATEEIERFVRSLTPAGERRARRDVGEKERS
jgi:cytohesin